MTKVRTQAEYARVMEQQEAARQKQLAEAKARQTRQAADAAARPEFKKWLDNDIIERNARSALRFCRTLTRILLKDRHGLKGHREAATRL